MKKKHLRSLEEKLDKLDSKLDEVDKTLVRNTVSLEEHIKRTNLLEEKLDPVEKHVYRVNGIVKFLGLISVVLGIVAAVIKMTH